MLTLLQCWPIPTDTLFAPPKESERTDDSDNPKSDIDTKTSDASSDEPDLNNLNKVITYGFGALGLSKHQNYCTYIIRGLTLCLYLTHLISPAMGIHSRRGPCSLYVTFCILNCIWASELSQDGSPFDIVVTVTFHFICNINT